MTSEDFCHGDDCFAAYTCTAETKWIPLRLWFNTAQPQILYRDYPLPKKSFELGSSHGVRKALIKKDWLDAMFYLNLAHPNFTKSSQIFNPSQIWAQYSEAWNPTFGGVPSRLDIADGYTWDYTATNYTQAFAMQFSLMLTSIMSQLPFSLNTAFYNSSCDTTVWTNGEVSNLLNHSICAKDTGSWIHADTLGDIADYALAITFAIRSSGYRWGFDTTLVNVAIAILLLHAVLTMTYLVTVVVSKPLIVTCWSSASEMMVLALCSLKPTALAGRSTGVLRNKDDRRLWREMVTIREVDGGEGLSLVAGNSKYYSGEEVGDLPRIGKKYN